jgi:F-type H+-transporting ATPase subunit b
LPALARLTLAAGGLTDVNLGLTIWTIVLFVLFAVVMTKLGWRPLLQAVEEREKRVRDAVEGAHRANTEAQSLLGQHRDLLREAAREREEILKRAQAEADQLKAELSARARAESEQLLKRARDQIERDKAQAIQELRAQVAEIAIAAAGKIVESSLTPQAQRKLVDDVIAVLPQKVK